jgi:hypothetical protein
MLRVFFEDLCEYETRNAKRKTYVEISFLNEFDNSFPQKLSITTYPLSRIHLVCSFVIFISILFKNSRERERETGRTDRKRS